MRSMSKSAVRVARKALAVGQAALPQYGKGRRFEAWAEIEQAVERAIAYWNEHKHPFIWSRRRRHRTPRCLGVAAPPNVALI